MNPGDTKESEKLFTACPKTSKGRPSTSTTALKQPLLLAGAAEDFKAAARKLNVGQKQQLLFDYSADAFQATIDIKPDYDFGNNNLGVYYARKNTAGRPRAGGEVLPRRLAVQPALCRRLQ